MQKIKKFYDSTFFFMFIGVVMYLLALPPMKIWILGWIVAAFWFPLICRKSVSYRQIWLAGVVFWGFAVFWVCYAYWATCFGWAAMCCYLGLYFPLFIFFARTIYHTKIYGNFYIPFFGEEFSMDTKLALVGSERYVLPPVV